MGLPLPASQELDLPSLRSARCKASQICSRATFLFVNASVRLLLVAALFLGSVVHAQTAVEREIDPELAAQIYSTPAIDNHAHPVLPPPAGKTDRDFDALPVDNMDPETDTVAWRTDNPQLPAAWKALWGFDAPVPFSAALDPAQMKRLNDARARVQGREGVHFDEWVLDQAKIGTMVANRVTMSAGVQEPRFRWVPYADALLFPFDNGILASETPDKALFFPLEDKLRARYLAELGLKKVPATLEEYLVQVVTPTLERQQRGGAIAEKFEVAYLRSFDFTDPPRNVADRIYSEGARTPQDYKLLQDFIFRYIAMECGRLGMAVHLHTLSGGGGYFGIAGANPMLLEPIFNDRRLRKTNFVMLHGGWPFVREAGSLLQKPNVYLDLSQQSLTFSPRTLAGWLREWLETYPEKVLFGTDGYALSDAEGWEESTWIANHNGREALALALTGMVRDGEISRQRASTIADEVLRGNAIRLYGMEP